ncbi:MAG: hypothetical protein IKJ46_06165, partial [Tidjanibacter sp.]|nr:hypothetical protein [Tidjanibacter sp.]
MIKLFVLPFGKYKNFFAKCKNNILTEELNTQRFLRVYAHVRTCVRAHLCAHPHARIRKRAPTQSQAHSL